MANRNIDESIRKPRRSKGTPFFVQRNYIAAGVIVLSGLSWILYESWSETKKLRKSLIDGKFDSSPELQQHMDSMRMTLHNPGLQGVMNKLRE